MFTTPPSAFDPWIVLWGPRRISIRSTASAPRVAKSYPPVQVRREPSPDERSTTLLICGSLGAWGIRSREARERGVHRFDIYDDPVAVSRTLAEERTVLLGIGDRSELRRLGIEARVDSPNVGRRMREHRSFAIQFRLNRNVGYNRKLATPLQQGLTGLQYLATH